MTDSEEYLSTACEQFIGKTENQIKGSCRRSCVVPKIKFRNRN